jgi:hypothetical protein
VSAFLATTGPTPQAPAVASAATALHVVVGPATHPPDRTRPTRARGARGDVLPLRADVASGAAPCRSEDASRAAAGGITAVERSA